jgi:hypothetical protein
MTPGSDRQAQVVRFCSRAASGRGFGLVDHPPGHSLDRVGGFFCHLLCPFHEVVARLAHELRLLAARRRDEPRRQSQRHGGGPDRERAVV